MKCETVTKEKIIEIATQMFAEKGFENTSMREIAEKAGISKPAIYYYFESKSKLFEEMIRHVFKEFGRSIIDVVNSDADPVEKIKGIIISVFRNTKKKPQIFKVVHDISATDLRCKVGMDFRKNLMYMRKKLKEIIDDGIRQGMFRGDIDKDTLIICFNGAVSLHILRFLRFGDIDLSDKRARELADILLNGILKRNVEE